MHIESFNWTNDNMEIIYYYKEDTESRILQVPADVLLEYINDHIDRMILLEEFDQCKNFLQQTELELEPEEWLYQVSDVDRASLLAQFINYCTNISATRNLKFFP